jgi:hypothetical protein
MAYSCMRDIIFLHGLPLPKTTVATMLDLMHPKPSSFLGPMPGHCCTATREQTRGDANKRSKHLKTT